MSLFIYVILGILVIAQWHIIGFLIHIFPITKEVEYVSLFRYSLHVVPVKVSCPFFFWTLRALRAFYIFLIPAVCWRYIYIYIYNIFSQSVVCFFTFLLLSFNKKISSFNVVQFKDFPFMTIFLLFVAHVLLKKSTSWDHLVVQWLSSHALLPCPGLRGFGSWVQSCTPLIKPCCGGIPHTK